MQSKLVRQTLRIIFSLLVFAFMAWQVYASHETVHFKITSVNLPRYFNPVQWNHDGWIMGMISDKFLEINPETGAWKLLYTEVWNALSNEQGQVLAFRNAKGLQYVDLAVKGKPISINTNPDTIINFWSPDGRYLFYTITCNGSSNYYIYDRVKDVSRVFEFQNVENFLSEPIAWKIVDGKERILFLLHFSISKMGDKSYHVSGYRSEFYLADSQGRFSPLFEVEDGEYVDFDGFSSDMQKFYFHFFSKRDQLWEFDLKTKEKRLRWTITGGKRIYLAGDWNLAVVEKDLLQLISMKHNKVLYKFTYAYNRVLWSPDQRKALILPALNNSVARGYIIEVQ